MKVFLELLTAFVILATALIGLNKTGVVEVPVIDDVPPLQHGGGGGEIDIPDEPVRVAVPDVRGDSLEEARDTLEERGLEVQRVDSIPIQLCDYETGTIERTLPPAGTEIPQGSGVIVYVCG